MTNAARSDIVCALYCGMAFDIMAPLTLIDNVDIIYAISFLDEAFSSDGTWEGVKRLIRSYLVDGNIDFMSERWEDHRNMQYEKSQLVSESEQFFADEMSIWRVQFIYKGKTRTLVYYNGWDFCKDWPVEIQRIDHVLSIGARFPLFDKPNLMKMLTERTPDVFRYYRCYYCENDCTGTVVQTQMNTVVYFDIDKNNVAGQKGAWF